MINRKLNSMLGGYDPAILMHDWWTALIASAIGETEYFLEEIMLYRQHGNNTVGSTLSRE